MHTHTNGNRVTFVVFFFLQKQLQVVAVAIHRPNVDFYHFHISQRQTRRGSIATELCQCTRDTFWRSLSRFILFVAPVAFSALQLTLCLQFILIRRILHRSLAVDLALNHSLSPSRCFHFSPFPPLNLSFEIDGTEHFRIVNVVKKLRRLYFIIQSGKTTTLYFVKSENR